MSKNQGQAPYQNCPIFNDGAFDALKTTPRSTTSTDANDTDASNNDNTDTGDKTGDNNSDPANAIIPLIHGQPIRFGTPNHNGQPRYGITTTPTGQLRIAEIGTNPDQTPPTHVLIHNAEDPDPTTAFALSRLTTPGTLHQAPIGIFRNTTRPTYDDQTRQQITTTNPHTNPHQALHQLLHNTDTWTIT